MSSKIVICIKGNSLDDILNQSYTVNDLDIIDIIEIRIDSIAPENYSEENIKNIKETFAKPLIFTCRTEKFGGFRSIDVQDQVQAYQTAINLDFEYIDIDLRTALKPEFTQLLSKIPKLTNLILSYHNFEHTDKDDIIFHYEKISNLNPKIIKIVTFVQNAKQASLLDEIQCNLFENIQKNEIAIFGMGIEGKISRVKGFILGNELTYLSLSSLEKTAPGQLDYRDFQDLAKEMINNEISVKDIFGRSLKIAHYGASHSKQISAKVFGFPKGIKVDSEKIQNELERRRPGRTSINTPRNEKDLFEFTSGVKDGVTTGELLEITIPNTDTRSKDYSIFKKIPRPSQVDYPALLRYGKFFDLRGSGRFSGRMTAPLVAIGAIAKDILKKRNIIIGAYTSQIGSIADEDDYPVSVIQDQVDSNIIRGINKNKVTKMLKLVNQVKDDNDSIGGIITVKIEGFPKGIGNPWFHSLEGEIAKAMLSIPATRGIEFGAGFKAAKMRGSSHNDTYIWKNNNIDTKSNNCGGIIGGISIGTPIIFRVAIKPTASIGKIQHTLNITTNKIEDLKIEGRHDPCIVPRAVVVLEAMTAILLLDELLTAKKIKQ